jgi:hypothetical protein
MILRNRLVEAELIKQLSLALVAPPHHRPPPSRIAPGNGITLTVVLQPPFATISAIRGHGVGTGQSIVVC